MPPLVGGGDPIIQRTLTGTDALIMVPLIFLIRFGLGTVSYAARTPGGLFSAERRKPIIVEFELARL